MDLGLPNTYTRSKSHQQFNQVSNQFVNQIEANRIKSTLLNFAKLLDSQHETTMPKMKHFQTHIFLLMQSLEILAASAHQHCHVVVIEMSERSEFLTYHEMIFEISEH